MLGVEPDCLGIKGVFLGKVDDSVGAVDAFEGESVGEFVKGEEFAVVFGRPAADRGS